MNLNTTMTMKMTVTSFTRQALGLALLGSILLLAACGDKPAQVTASSPVEIDRSTTCSLDGMLLADYPGPKAQIIFEGQAQPAFFCDTMELIHTLKSGEQVRAVRAAYVQDMGQADWDHPQGHWTDAKTAVYVVGSKRHGSMGPTMASFADRAKAEQFAAEFGGKLMSFDEIKPGMADLSGGALHDSHM